MTKQSEGGHHDWISLFGIEYVAKHRHRAKENDIHFWPEEITRIDICRDSLRWPSANELFRSLGQLGDYGCKKAIPKKPQDIRTSTQLSDENFQPVCAYMYMLSGMSSAYDGTMGEFLKLRLGPGVHGFKPATLGNDMLLLPVPKTQKGTVVTIAEGETLDDTNIGPIASEPHRMTRAERRELDYKQPVTLTKYPQTYRPAVVHLDAIGVTRWKLASDFIKKQSFRIGPRRHPQNDIGTEYVVDEVSN